MTAADANWLISFQPFSTAQDERFANHKKNLADAVKLFPLPILCSQQADNNMFDQCGMALACGLTGTLSPLSQF